MSEADEALIDVARSFWTANDKAERLQKEVDRLRAVNAKLVEALERIALYNFPHTPSYALAHAALAAAKGE